MYKNNSKNLNKEPIQKYLPLIIVILYLSLTVLLFAFGPWEYPVENKLYFYSFLILVELMLSIGYFYGINKKVLPIENENRGYKVFKRAMFIFILLIPFTNFLNTGSFLFNFGSLTNLGGAYIESLSIRQNRSISLIISYVRIFLSPYIISFLPLGIFYWDKLSKSKKILFVLGVFGGLGLDLFRGTNKSLADYLIVFLAVLMAKIIINSRESNLSLSRKKIKLSTNLTFTTKLIKIISIMIPLTFLFFVFFSNTAPKRYGVSLYGPNNQYMLNIEHPLLNLFDSYEIKLAIASLISYFTQGYYALGLAMEKPFMSSFGFGSSMAVLINISNLFNTNAIFERTYVYRNFIENGWDWHGKWSSFYVWVASDISFLGVIILMFFIGYLLARSWNKMVICKDYVSIIVFVQLMILCFYLPANNQLFQFFEGLVGNMFWIIIWLMRKKKGFRKVDGT